MSLIQRIFVAILAIPIVLCIGAFAISAAVNGVDEAVDMALSTPRNLLCSIVPFCDSTAEEAEIVDEQLVWTRIHERALLDLAKYEQRRDWRATVTTVFVDHSMRMRATVNVTLAINLDNTHREDIVVDDETETITITLSQAQPVECFLTDIEYYDRSCIGVCGELEDKLLDQARDSWQNDDNLQIRLDEAFERGKIEITNLIEPIAKGYTIELIQDPEPPPPITSGSCYSG